MFIPNADKWIKRRMLNPNQAPGEWTISGSNITFWPPPGGPVTSPATWQIATNYYPGQIIWDAQTANSWNCALGHMSASSGLFAADRAARPTLWAADPTIARVTGNAETASFNYLDKNCLSLTPGGYGDSFMADTDSFRLDERLLKLGMIWQWKAQKGTPLRRGHGHLRRCDQRRRGRRQAGSDPHGPSRHPRSPVVGMVGGKMAYLR